MVIEVPMEDVTILIRAAASEMQRHDDQPARWGMYSAAAEICTRHNAGEIDLNRLPNTRLWIEHLLGHTLEASSEPTTVGDVLVS